MADSMRRPAGEVRAKLLNWYRAHRRDLPWRKTRDPYAIWVSEIMLQQTRVDTVIPYYKAFLARWPTVTDLADADPDDIRAAWSGLGYYRRARLMMDAARLVRDRFDGHLPETAEALLALPGFGRYTAGAVASIAFDAPAAAVDGNVARVLARLDGIHGDLTRGAPLRALWALAENLAPGEAPGEYTQAVIELGALVCATKRPKCLLCPVAEACVAHAEGLTDQIPAPKKKIARRSIELTALLWCTEGQILLQQQPEGGLFAGLWTPPLFEGTLEPDAAQQLAPSPVQRGRVVGEMKHILTHRDLRVRLIRTDGTPRAVKAPARWVALSELDAIGVPSLTVKALRTGLGPEELDGLALPGRRTSRRS